MAYVARKIRHSWKNINGFATSAVVVNRLDRKRVKGEFNLHILLCQKNLGILKMVVPQINKQTTEILRSGGGKC